MTKGSAFFIAAAFACAPLQEARAGARVPSQMIGTWSHGACANPANRLVISAHTATIGRAKPAAIYYDPDDGGAHAAVHWSQEYVVDNFVYVSNTDVIVHNTQGFGMSGASIYKRCRAGR